MTQAYTEAVLIEGDEFASRQAKELVANTLGVGVDEVSQKIDLVIHGIKSAERGEPDCAQPPSFVSIGDKYVTRIKDIRSVLIRDKKDSVLDFEVEILYCDGQLTLIEMGSDCDDPVDKVNWLAGLKDVLNGNVN